MMSRLKHNNSSPHLRPTSSLAIATHYHSFLAASLAFIASLSILLSSPIIKALCILAEISSPSMTALAASLIICETLALYGVYMFFLLPLQIPLNRPFHGRMRYRRTHFSHMRLDRLRRAVVILASAHVQVDTCFSSTPPSIMRSQYSHIVGGTSSTPFLVPQQHLRSRLRGGGPPGSVGNLEIEDLDNYDSDFVTHPIVIDSDSDEALPTRSISDWIGCGQTWGSSVPQEVRKACGNARILPDLALNAVIPPPTLSVINALSPEWLTPPPTNPPIPLPDYSSHHHPNVLTGSILTDEDIFLLQSLFRQSLFDAIPHAIDLSARFNQAWLDGAESLSISSAPNYRYPLWVTTLVGELRKSVRKQLKWTCSIEWLQNVWDSNENPFVAELTEKCWDYLNQISWDAVVPNVGTSCHLTTEALATFLSNDWLDDDMMNAGANFINRHLDFNRHAHITNCLWMDVLRSQRLQDSTYRFREKSSLDNAIRSGLLSVVDIPVNPGNHWTCLRLDIPSRTVAYMDNLNPSATPPPEMFRLLMWYLDSVLPSQAPHSFSTTSLSFPVPLQRDGYSCGVAILSTLAHAHLGYAPWSPETATAERMQWFIRLADGLLCRDQKEDSDDETGDDPSPDQPSPPSTASSSSNSSSINDIQSASPSPACSHTISESESSTSSSNEGTTHHHRHRHRRRRVHVHGKMETSSSWAKKNSKSEAMLPSSQPETLSFDRFRMKILADDPHAEFDAHNLRSIRCSCCAKWISMRTLYDTRRWKDHRASAQCRKMQQSKLFTKSLRTFFSTSTTKEPPSPAQDLRPSSTPTTTLLCPGLLADTYETITTYLARTSTAGGGAPSRKIIALSLFPELDNNSFTWASLTLKQQHMVLRREELQYRWVNRRAVGAVFSSKCQQNISVVSEADSTPCMECRKLWKLRTFRNILRRKVPDEENMKYVPKAYRCPELGTIYLKYRGVRELMEKDDGNSPWLRFAQGAVTGLYKSQSVLLGMVEATVKKSERLLKGKALQNMHYSEALDSFCSMLASTSSRAYRTFRRHFGGRSIRSMQKLRAKLPRFEAGFSEANVQQVAKVLHELDYHGPLGISWDDTDLEKALSIWQESRDSWLVIGAANGPMHFGSLEEVDNVFEDGTVEKADKLRIWVITIPLPKIPPILAAAVAHSNSDNADQLVKMHFTLMELLHKAGIHPISQAADGTESERSSQRLITAAAHSALPYCILNDIPGCTLHLNISMFHGRPSITVQDSKHGGKTVRNQLTTGARFLTLGNFVMIYSMVRDLAAHALGPLFRRDVERVDKQDDRAAARLLAGETLDFHIKTFPQQTGLSVYLFVLGELIDAWQNRSIPHIERIRMVLRARFILMAWYSHIGQHPLHQHHIHFISHESFDILTILCDSLIQLVIIHRQFYPRYPLLPWLHSTEPCEHIFGMIRQLKKDFTYADMLYLEPKLRTLMMGAFQDLTPEEKASQTAAGYHHTYFHAPDLNLSALLQWPTDDDLTTASSIAFSEAESLLLAVGIDAKAMVAIYQPPPLSRLMKKRNLVPPRGPQTLQEILTFFAPPRRELPTQTEREVQVCEMALVADNVNQTLNILSLPDSKPTEMKRLRARIDENDRVSRDIQMRELPQIQLSRLTLVDPTTYQLARETLVAERCRHQPLATTQALRQASQWSSGVSSKHVSETGLAVRDALVKRIEALSPYNGTTKPLTSGVNRQVRHSGLYAADGQPMSTRARQKDTLRAVNSTKFARCRDRAFANLQAIHEAMYTANITSSNPLRPGSLVVALQPGTDAKKAPVIILGEVVTLYSTSGAKGARHDWIDEIKSVGDPSYVMVQVYTHSHGSTYTSLTCKSLECNTFLRLPRTHLIFSLPWDPTATATPSRRDISADAAHPMTFVTLSPQSTAIFLVLLSNSIPISNAVRALTKMLKGKEDVETVSTLEQTVAQDEYCGDDESSGESDIEIES
ncbi:hypothetical protein QCA50_006275 [Cerrena zonata]|uniref:Ubiquitin-like protease family profile domain-containing protein n=1 Tax=Cerrena zonata TaxID=2478898 RepID=A0AAW0GHB9_9APHY